MDAVKFIEEYRRICDTADDCDKCIFSTYNAFLGYSCDVDTMSPEKIVEKVEKWSEENPIRTLLTDVKEKLPDIQLDKDGVPAVCPFTLYKDTIKVCEVTACENECVLCWTQELK